MKVGMLFDIKWKITGITGGYNRENDGGFYAIPMKNDF